MSRAFISRGPDFGEPAPARTLAQAFGDVNGMTAELYAKADSLLGGRRARIATIGNSHSTKSGLAQAIMYSLWRYYPADVYFDYRVQQGSSRTDASAFDPAKGDIFGVGQSTTSEMVTYQLPRLRQAIAAGRTYDLLYIDDAGFNDSYTSAALVAAGVGNIITVANTALADGVRLVVIFGAMPAAAGSTTLTASWYAEANQLLRNYAAATPGVAFQEQTSLFANHNETSVYLTKRFGNVYQGYTVDGTHLSGFGARLLAPELAKYHRAIARPRTPRVFGNNANFDVTVRPSVNLLGNGAGNMQGTAGLKNSNTNANVAGINTTTNQLRLNDAGTANNVATPSIVVGPDGFTRQRLTMSGQTATQATINLQFYSTGLTNVNGGTLTRGFDFECVVEIGGGAGISGSTPVTGLGDVFVRSNGATSDTPYFSNGAGGVAADLWPDNTTETLFVYSTVPETFAANLNTVGPTLFLGFTADRTPSGTIDISRASFQRVTTD